MLSDVQRAIVNYVEAPEYAGSMDGVVGMLRQIHGTVEMLELYGASMLAKEMEIIVDELFQGKLSNRDEALEVLMRAALQLPDYLGRIKEGSPDVPLVLLPLLNDLRAARGEALLSEAVFFVPDLTPITADKITQEEEEQLTEVVRVLRLPFMQALAGWYRDENDDACLRRMSRVFSEIENVSHSQQSRKIWPICRALVESLFDRGLRAGASVKLLLGQVERSLKSLLEQGESAYFDSLPNDLLKNLLYYIARSKSENPLVAEIRREYRLGELLPQQDKLEQARLMHQGPNVELLKVANQGVQDDISGIKDLIEIYVHAEERELKMLRPLDGMLRRVCDTLSMLGVGEARSLLEPKQREMRDALASEEAPKDESLFDIAAALLKVEDMLDRHIAEKTSLVEPEPALAAMASNTADILSLRDLPDREYKALVQSLIKESLRAFARMREAFIGHAAQSDNTHHIDQVPGLLGEVIGVFELMGNDILLPLLYDLRTFVAARYVKEGIIPELFEQELVADAITSIEYYLESIPDDSNRQERDYVISVSRSALDQLMALNEVDVALQHTPETVDQTGVTEIVDLTDIGPEASEPDPVDKISLEHDATVSLSDETMQIDHLTEGDMENDQTILLKSLEGDGHDLTMQLSPSEIEEAKEQESSPASAAEAKSAAAPAPEKTDRAPLRVIGDDIDEEILDIFIEEAVDELGAINEHLPLWKEDNEDEESLTRVRRAFHTLKGSGRLVGAEVIGEFAWCNENLLNYVLRGDLAPTSRLFELLDDSIAVLPQLIAQLRGDDNQVEFYDLMDNINTLIDRTINPVEEASEEKTLADIEEGDEEDHDLASPQPVGEFDRTILLDNDLENDQTIVLEDGPLGEADPLDMSVVDVDDYGIGHLDTGEFDLSELDYTLGFIEVDEEIEEEPVEAVDIATPAVEEVVEQADEVHDQQEGDALKIDPVLLDIFTKESQVHLETIQSILKKATELSGIVQPGDALIRALHTLRGSAQTAQVDPIARIAGPLEKVAKHKREISQIFSVEESALLQRAADGIADSLIQLNAKQSIPAAVNALGEEIETYAEKALSEFPVDDIDEGDNELRQVFIEEAEELINATEAIIGQWRATPENFQPVADMKRRLHTLKGGARMAGYASVADLTHMLESSVIARESSSQTPSDNYFDLLQEAVDALAVNVDQASKGQKIGRYDWISDALNEDMHALGHSAIPDDTLIGGENAVEMPEEPEPDMASNRSATIADLADQHKEADPEQPSSVVELPTPTSAESSSEQEASEPEAAAPKPDNVVPLKMTAHAIEEALKDHNAPASLAPARTAEEKSQEQVRVRSELLDSLVNNAGEVSIYHARFGQQIGDMRFNLGELDQTVERLREQLRMMDQETEAQILYGYDKNNSEGSNRDRDFDPLELDRYSQIQELSRSLLESVADLENIKGTLAELTRDSETLLLQQSRVSSELQEGLLRTRMVRFDRVEARLARIVRQTAQTLNKKAVLTVVGGENEIDRGVQERMIAPLEHILRNAVAHGIEAPEERLKRDKSETGKVAIRLSLDGGDILIRIVDDGAGINVESVRRTAVARKLINPDAQINDQDVLQLLFESGFSTAEEVTQIAGRGIGLDVVGREIKQLGGSLTLESDLGVGTMFVIRLPQTLAISQALLVQSAGETYAVPINGIRGVSRVTMSELSQYYLDPEKRYHYAGEDYQVIHLTSLLQTEDSQRKPTEQVPLIMVRSGNELAAVQVDELVGRREIVVKSGGVQLSMLNGIAGATLLGDGTVVLVLDIGGLLQTLERTVVEGELTQMVEEPVAPVVETPSPQEKSQLTVMVVDDSITIRKVTARMLERHNLQVLTAKDGVDAVAQLREQKPDLMLLDIEMPRMDGFEVASYVRNDSELNDLPIIVITSRTGEKHRQRMFDIGVNQYLGKPYQETELLQLISEVLQKELVSQ